jgi:hypothetical protein
MAKNRYGELGRANLAWNGTLFADEGGEGMDATRARKPDPAKGGTEPDGVMF